MFFFCSCKQQKERKESRQFYQIYHAPALRARRISLSCLRFARREKCDSARTGERNSARTQNQIARRAVKTQTHIKEVKSREREREENDKTLIYSNCSKVKG